MEVPHPAQFAVVKFSDGWRVLAQGRRLARLCDYRIDAEEAALRFASVMRATGGQPEMFVQEPYGELRRLAM
jgi:hypothetical protein